MSRFEILKQSNSSEEIKEINYQSQFDFEKFEIEDEETKNEISQKEEEILSVGKQLAKKTLELGKLLYETQRILSNNKNGTFVAWFNYMGFDKSMVYREINRWEMFMKYKNPQIAEASIRTIEFIKKNEEELKEVEIIEILEEPSKASEKIKEIKNKEKIGAGFDEIADESVKEIDTSKEIAEIDKKIEKLYKKIEELKEQKRKLEG